MNPPRLHILSVILLLMVAAACSRHSAVSDTLVHAETIMEEHPDSALAILEAIPDSTLTTKADRALHALLLSQALDKNYIDITSDSLINIAVNYYSHTNDAKKKALSFYQLSRVQYNSGNMSNALTSLMEALEVIPDTGNYVLKGLIHRSMSDIYRNIYNVPLYEENAAKALSYFEKAKDFDYISYAKLELAGALTAGNNLKEAIVITQNVVDSAKNRCDSVLMKAALIYLGNAQFGNNDYNDARTSYKNILSYDNVDPSVFLNLIECCKGLGYNQEADSLLEVLVLNSDNSMSGSRTVYAHHGEWEKAYRAAEEEIAIQDSIQRILLNEYVIKSAVNYHNEKKESLKEEIANQRNRYILIIIIIVLLLGIGILFVYIKYKEKKLKEVNAIMIIEELNHTLISSQNIVTTYVRNLDLLQEKVRELFKKRFEGIDELVQFYYEIDNGEPDKTRTKLALNVISSIERIGKDRKTIKELESYANKYLGNIIIEFNNLFPELRNEEKLLFLYSVLGFSPRTMSVFLKVDIKSIYNWKSRLKKKIAINANAKSEMFLQFLT